MEIQMKFKIIKNIINVGDLHKKLKEIKDSGNVDDSQCPGAPSFYKLDLLNKIHIKLLPILEKEFNVKLYPTYTYCRIYNSKSHLKLHIDRPACEFSVTLNIGYDGDYTWPIWIQDFKGNKTEAILKAGDGLIYRGTECEHWRKDADERVKCQTQGFFHYVDQDGPYENCIFDLVKL